MLRLVGDVIVPLLVTLPSIDPSPVRLPVAAITTDCETPSTAPAWSASVASPDPPPICNELMVVSTAGPVTVNDAAGSMKTEWTAAGLIESVQLVLVAQLPLVVRR